MVDKKLHWENVFTNKQAHEVSWTQDVPHTSLDFIDGFNLPKTASIIDIGGGDSKLVDFLLAKGYRNITVLDISEKALERAKLRLGEQSALVKWIVSDITEFEPDQGYDIWHDRAAFHFLTTEEQISRYITIASRAVKQYMVIGTFSNDGPQKCSGLEIRQYSGETLSGQFAGYFEKIKCVTEDHITPFQTKQNFLFCSFSPICNA
ncbi:MAG: class I SAM-dependent methyltransferase [Candidatus Pedobacter colombiensis]|uniref:Class I SAM-dependent methyltransferase n=1 Tax=Candidatus Pedobacter colombiensis TaxID=3121371 RepID=A0AAJ5W6L0_9SPHI|nr:class I SAM-dependent methyltransferase [Pedobacter sp.]WEK17939.1 MAG: class I SAM-dependent methyltransferase [Pedobacter sp.]